MLAASPIRAEESSRPPEHKTFVVRPDLRTGRLVRSVVVSPLNAGDKIAGAAATFDALVEQAAKAHDVDPLLVHSMIKTESGYNAYAVSPKGAEGLMQLTPPTARMLGVTNSFDPQQNIEAGVKYLKYLQTIYKDDRLALAAYNAGPGAVEKYKWIPPYPETQNYVYQVGKRYGEARKAAAAPTPAPTKEPAPVVTREHPMLEHFIDENGRLHLKTTP
jgi:soluble lytic murein transglycosylase-like protein